VRSIPLKRIARLQADVQRSDPDGLLTLDVVESGTGRLLSDPWKSPSGPPSAGVADVEPGDVLFGKLRPYLAKVVHANRSAYASTELMCLRPRPGIDPRWFFYRMLARPTINWAVAASEGTKMPRTSWERLGEFRVDVPEETEQRALAEYLDAEAARIDALISKKRQLQARVDERTRVELTEVACGRTSGQRLRDSELPWLGAIPATWQVERLKFMARLETGHTPSRTRPELWENATTPWVTLNEVGYLKEHQYVHVTTNFISEEGLASSSARVLPAGTVILSRDATVGRCGILARPMATSQHFVNWICGERLKPEYLWLVLRTAMQGHFISLTAGATIKTIGMPQVNEFVVPLPSLGEQEQLTQDAVRIRGTSESLIASIDLQISRLREHRQALITAAVTGELNVPGTA